MNRPDVEKLLGGYATGTLTESEKTALFSAALEHQEIFDALMDEEALRDLLADPVARKRLLSALSDPVTVKVQKFWRRPAVLGLAASLLMLATTTAVLRVRERNGELRSARIVKSTLQVAEKDKELSKLAQEHWMADQQVQQSKSEAAGTAKELKADNKAAATADRARSQEGVRQEAETVERIESRSPWKAKKAERRTEATFGVSPSEEPSAGGAVQNLGAGFGDVPTHAPAPTSAPAPLTPSAPSVVPQSMATNPAAGKTVAADELLESAPAKKSDSRKLGFSSPICHVDIVGDRVHLNVVWSSMAHLYVLNRSSSGTYLMHPKETKQGKTDRISTFEYSVPERGSVEVYLMAASVPDPSTLPADGPIDGYRWKESIATR